MENPSTDSMPHTLHMSPKLLILLGAGCLIIIIFLVKVVQLHRSAPISVNTVKVSNIQPTLLASHTAQPTVDTVIPIPIHDSASGINLYKNQSYQVAYPDSWLIKEYKTKDSYVELSAVKGNPVGFYDRVLIQPIPNAPQIQEELPAAYKTMGISPVTKQINGRPVVEYSGVFKTVTLHEQSITYPHWESTVMVPGGTTVFMVTYQYQGSSADQQKEATLEKIIGSLLPVR